MSNRPCVLSVCSDVWLAQTRHEVLTRQFDAISIHSAEEMHSLSTFASFAVVLLCHSLSTEECVEIEAMAQLRWSDARFLSLTSLSKGYRSIRPHDEVAGLDGPLALLAAIWKLLHATPAETYATA